MFRLSLSIFLSIFVHFAQSTRRPVDEFPPSNASQVQQQDDPDHQLNCSLIPPALWCAVPVRENCGTQRLCARYEKATGKQPLHITVLYESLCPDSQQFIVSTLFDIYLRFGARVKFELVPFGNGRVDHNGQIQCQHGSEECRINKFQSCAIHYIADPVMFIYCQESLLADKMPFEEVSKLCFDYLMPNNYYTHSQIIQCANGTEGDALQKLDWQKTHSVWPDKHQYVPWIVVNGVSMKSKQFLQSALPALICESLAQDDYLLECDLFSE